MSRRSFNHTVMTGVLGVAAAGIDGRVRNVLAREVSKERRPNFVFICSDQHSAQYTGFGGHPLVQTPHLDRIAKDGVVFTSAYCGSPLCVPGRSSLMTGMYASDVNSFCNSTVHDDSHPTWGKRLRDSGYHCWATGKQDLNPACDLGFVEADVENGHARKPDIMSLFRSPVGYRLLEREGIDGASFERAVARPRKGKDMTISDRDDIAQEHSMEFLLSQAKEPDRPWTMFVGFRAPHPPWNGLKKFYDGYLPRVQVPQVSIDELEQLPLAYQVMRNFKRISTPIPEERMRRAIAAYYAMISELDERIGILYRQLEKTGALENTFFIYTSDHGESLGQHGMWLKNNLFEGPTRIPMLIAGPGLPKGKRIDTPVGHVDLIATMLQIAGLEIPQDLRGISLVPLMKGEPDAGPAFVYSESHSEGNPTGSFMIRKGDWKYISFCYFGECLFNLKEDPQERRNRIDDPNVQGIADDLRAILRRQVDPEEVTERAFAVQRKVLERFVSSMDEEQLFNLFKSRMGDGQANVIAKGLKRKM